MPKKTSDLEHLVSSDHIIMTQTLSLFSKIINKCTVSIKIFFPLYIVFIQRQYFWPLAWSRTRLTHFLVLLHTVPLLSEGLQPPLLVLRLPAAQDAHELQGEGVAQAQGVPQGDAQVRVAAVGHVHHLRLVHVQPSPVVQQVSAQHVLLAEDQLVVEQEEAALLHFALPDDPRQLAGVDQLRAALQDVAPLRRGVKGQMSKDV